MPRRRGRVLVLDDDPLLCEFLQRALEEIGVEVTACHSPSGMRDIEQTGGLFNLILTTLPNPQRQPIVTPADLEIHFPDIPVLKLEVVLPFSVGRFQEAAIQRMRRHERPH